MSHHLDVCVCDPNYARASRCSGTVARCQPAANFMRDALAAEAAEKAATCKRCGKTGHGGRKCKAPFAKSWPGRTAMKILLRFPDGMTLDMSAALTQDQFDRIHAVCLETWRGTAPSETATAAVPS